MDRSKIKDCVARNKSDYRTQQFKAEAMRSECAAFGIAPIRPEVIASGVFAARIQHLGRTNDCRVARSGTIVDAVERRRRRTWVEETSKIRYVYPVTCGFGYTTFHRRVILQTKTAQD